MVTITHPPETNFRAESTETQRDIIGTHNKEAGSPETYRRGFYI